MTSNQFKPEKCERCHSNRIIPIIEGSPTNREALILDLQGKIKIGGCFEICNGSALWACADCGCCISDDAFCLEESNRELVKAYNEAVDNAFDSLEMIDEKELRKLKGLDLLCVLSKIFLSNEFFELERGEESYLIKNIKGTELEFKLNSLLKLDCFCQMDEYLGEEKKKEFSVRINKEECVAVATRVAPGRIQVKRI